MKFIETSINFQQNSSSKEEANKCFERSCSICSNRGLHIECDHCQIRMVHEMTISIFDDLLKTTLKKMVE